MSNGRIATMALFAVGYLFLQTTLGQADQLQLNSAEPAESPERSNVQVDPLPPPPPPLPDERQRARPAADAGGEASTADPMFAFERRALVEPVEAAGSIEDFPELAAGRPPAKPSDICVCRFPGPAHFPRPRFGQGGQRMDSEGVVIFEGMQFAFDNRGHYRVSFTAETPAVPVRLRLQFLLHDPDRPDLPPLQVTLPTIRVPETARALDAKDSVENIVHGGYSSALAECFGHHWIVVRQGTCRFGFGFEGLRVTQ